MAAQEDNNILGLRAQIIENFRFTHEHIASSHIIIRLKGSVYAAAIVQHSRTIIAGTSCTTIEGALRSLLDQSSREIGEQMTRVERMDQLARQEQALRDEALLDSW